MKIFGICLLIILSSCKKESPEDAKPTCPDEQVIGCQCANGEGFHFGSAGYSGQCKGKGGVIYWHCN